MTSRNVTRRDLLKIGAATAAGELATVLLHGCGGGGASPGPSVCSKLNDIEHAVIFIQENRSFDHYFGSYRGVRGFSDRSAAFQQPDPANTTGSPVGTLLPFHLDNAAMNGFVSSRLLTNPNDAVLSMGYYTRPDLPYYYALADAFTICDNYFCSVIGPTDPNRLYSMAASVDPDGRYGGPLLETLTTNRQTFFGRMTDTT